MAEIVLFATAIASTHIIPAWGADGSEHLHLDEAFLIPMTLMMGAEWKVAVTFLLGVLVGQLLQNKEWYKTVFNTIQMSFAAFVSAALASALGLTLFGAALGAITYSLLSLVAVVGIVWFAEHKNLISHLPSTMEFRGVMLGTGLVLGIAMNYSITSMPLMFPVVAALCVGLQTWYAKSRVPVLQLGVINA